MLLRRAAITSAFVSAFATGAASSQDATPLKVVEVSTPERPLDAVLVDANGDRRADLLVRAPGPALVLRLSTERGFEPPRFARPPIDAVGFLVGVEGGRAAAFFADGRGGAVARAFSAFDDPPTVASADGPSPPPLLGFAVDLDLDLGGDLALPDSGGFVVALSNGRRISVRPPKATTFAAEKSGLASRTRVFPSVSFEKLEAKAPFVPAFFENGALYRLDGDFEAGFGPNARRASAGDSGGDDPAEGTLERNEARLVDLDSDGAPELAHVRTATTARGLSGAKTTVVFKRLDPNAPKPLQAILLPGVLSNGPDFFDADKDGRVDCVVSVFGDDLKARVARGLRGATELKYFVYRGLAGAEPFERTPAATIVDDVPTAVFDVWSLRHRRLFGDDWTGDGVPDLASFETKGDATAIEVRAGASGGVAYAEKPARRATLPFVVDDVRRWSLPSGAPALIFKGAGRVAIVSSE
jgi:hypothetical protein